MSTTKRTTIYLDPVLHKALRLKSAETMRSVSDLVNEAVRDELAEDADDLAAFEGREEDDLVSFEDFIKELKRVGTIQDPLPQVCCQGPSVEFQGPKFSES